MAKRLLRVLLLSVIVTIPAQAGKLFKIVDADGNVTYQSSPPSGNSGSIEQRDIYGGEDPEEDAINRDRAALNHPVTLYAIKKCRPCDNARIQLQERKIPFKEKDPTSSPKLYKAFTELVNGTTVPAVAVGDNIVLDYTKDSLGQALDAAGYPALEKKETEETIETEEQADELQ